MTYPVRTCIYSSVQMTKYFIVWSFSIFVFIVFINLLLEINVRMDGKIG